MPYSVSSYLNVSFIHSMILDCLPGFQVINEKETLVINKSFCFENKYVKISMPKYTVHFVSIKRNSMHI